MVYYGPQTPPEKFASVDLAIVEPGHFSPFDTLKTRWIAYLSVGEIHEGRTYFEKMKKAGVILEPNPQWAGAFRADLRKEIWQKEILEEIIPAFLKQGFHGVFLDTIDTPLYFEEVEKLQGSRQALLDLVGKMKARFPKLQVLVNNGLPALSGLSAFIDGVVVEDLYTHYDFEKKTPVATTSSWDQSKEDFLDKFRAVTAKPVYVILYGDPKNSKVVKQAIKRCEEKGYGWFATTPDLQKLP